MYTVRVCTESNTLHSRLSKGLLCWPRADGEDTSERAPVDEGDASEDDVRMVLSEEEVQRWRWLKSKRDVERGSSAFLLR